MNITIGSVIGGCIIVSTLALTSCASSNSLPDWVDNPAAKYADKEFLTATGEADKRQAAADRALANLARIFEVEVIDTSLDFSSAAMSMDGATADTVNEQRVSRTISTEAKQVVEGAKVVEYFESELGRVHALAVLDKQAAASRFRQGILQADRQVNDLLNYANQQAPNPVSALSALQQARIVQLNRDGMQRNLLVVADGRGINTPHDTASIESTLRQALASLRCAVVADDPSVKMELQRAVNQMGIQVDSKSNLRFTGLLDITPIEQRQAWYWVRGSYELILTDGSTVLAKQRWPIKASATDESLVEQRLRDIINRQLPAHLFEMLTSEAIR